MSIWVDRIDQLLDDGLWAEPAGFGRQMWEAQLLVEFLGEVEGYRLADLVREEVTQTFARDAMMDWHQGRGSGPTEGPAGTQPAGIPSQATATRAWIQVSGPGDVTFADASAANAGTGRPPLQTGDGAGRR